MHPIQPTHFGAESVLHSVVANNILGKLKNVDYDYEYESFDNNAYTTHHGSICADDLRVR